MLDVGGETGDNFEDELFCDFFGGEFFLQMFEDLHAQERQVQFLALVELEVEGGVG